MHISHSLPLQSGSLNLNYPLVPLLHLHQFKCCSFSKATSSGKPLLVSPLPTLYQALVLTSFATDCLVYPCYPPSVLPSKTSSNQSQPSHHALPIIGVYDKAENCESLPCAWHCAKNFAWVLSPKRHINPKRCEDLLVASFYG